MDEIEYWIITQGCYDYVETLGVVDSKERADALVRSTEFYDVFNHKKIHAEGPYVMNEMNYSDD